MLSKSSSFGRAFSFFIQFILEETCRRNPCTSRSSRRAEQLALRTQQRIVATVEDSVLRTEMGALESQEEYAPKRILWYKPLGFLGVI